MATRASASNTGRSRASRIFWGFLRISGTALSAMLVAVCVLCVFWEPYVDAWHDVPILALIETMAAFVGGYALVALAVWHLRGRPQDGGYAAEAATVAMFGMNIVLAFAAWQVFSDEAFLGITAAASIAIMVVLVIVLLYGEILLMSRMRKHFRRVSEK